MSFSTAYGKSRAVRNVVETLTQSQLLQIDPQRDVVFETPPPEVISSISRYFEAAVRRASPAESSLSDSDSLFLTQSVTPVDRTIKRTQSSARPALLPLSVESEDECERDHSQGNAPHQEEGQDTLLRGVSDTENSDDDLVSKARTILALHMKRAGRSGARFRRRASSRPKRTVFPFLQKSPSGCLSLQKNHILVNSEIGGFFKCVKKLNKGREGSRRELSPSIFPSELGENRMEQDTEDVQDDIRKVDAECFVSNAHRRNREKWLPKERWKNKMASKKYDRESYRDCEERTGKKKRKKDTKKKQEETVSKSGENQSQVCIGSAARTSRSPTGSPNIRSFLMAQEEDSQRQPEVLVTYSQSQSMDWRCGGDHPRRQVAQGGKNFETAGAESETVVEETQRPDSIEEAAKSHASKTLEDRSRSGARGEDGLSVTGLHEKVETVRGTSEETCPEPQETEELGLEREGWMWSQDLFAEQENQADETAVSSPLKEVIVGESKEDLESCVVQNSDIILLGKKKNKDKPSDISLDVVDRPLVDNAAELLRSSQRHVPKLSKITSPRTEEIKQTRKETHKKTKMHGSVELACPEENVQFRHRPLSDVHPALVDSPSGSNLDSDFCLDVVADIQKHNIEKVDTPVFNYGGLMFLKKRKRKKTETYEVSLSSAPLQPDADQNKSFTSQAHDSGLETVQKKRKSLVGRDNEGEMTANNTLLVVAAGTSPKNTFSVDSLQSLDIVQDSEAHAAKGSELKAKKKKTKDRNAQSLPQESEGTCKEEGVQTPHQAPERLGSVADGRKKLKVTDLSSPSRSDEASSEFCSARVHKISENVFKFGDFEPQRKKAKKSNSRSEMSGVVTMQCDREFETGHDTGAKTAEKKIQGSLLQASGSKRQNGEINEIKLQSKKPPESLNSSEVTAFTEHSANCVSQKADDLTLVTPRRKKKKKKEKEVVENVEGSKDFEIPEEILDSEQQAIKVIPDTKVKKKKKKPRTCQDAGVTHEEEAMDSPCTASDRVDPPSSGMETNLSQQVNSSEIHEEGYGPDYVGGSTPLKKKKKRKTMENGFFLGSDGMGTIEGDQTDLCLTSGEQKSVEKHKAMTRSGPRRREEHIAACLEAGAEPESTHAENYSKGKKKTMSLWKDAEGSQSASQTEERHEPKSNEKKKKKKKRQSEADRNVECGFCGDDAEHVGCLQNLQSSETKSQKKRKKKNRWDDVDSGQDSCSGLAKELKILENHREVSVTQPEKVQQKDGSVASTSRELLQNVEKNRKKKKQEQVAEENVETGQPERTKHIEISEEILDSEQQAIKVIPDTKVKKKKKKPRTCQDAGVTHEEEAMDSPCTASDRVDPPSSGMETNLSQQVNSSEIHEEGYGPDYVGGSPPLKKKKKRKTMENGFSLGSDGMGTIEGDQTDLCLTSGEQKSVEKDKAMTRSGPRRREEHIAACLEAGAEPESTHAENYSKGKKKTMSLWKDAEGSQSASQTEERHEPKSNEKKKKKKKRQSEADRNVECGFCGDDAEHVGCLQNLQSSETKSQKKRKKKNRWDDADSGQDSCSGLAKELKILENHREVSVTQPEKVQQKDGSVASTSRELLQNVEKNRKKKKQEQVAEENVETGQPERTKHIEISEEILDSEQQAIKVIPDTKVKKKKKKPRTCQDAGVTHEEEAMDSPCTASDRVDPPSSGMETNLSQQVNSSEIHEEGYGPDYVGGSPPLKKKKKRKTMENGFSLGSDGMGTIEGDQTDLCLTSGEQKSVEKDKAMTRSGPRRREEHIAACLEAGAEPESTHAENYSKGKKKTMSLWKDAEGSQSASQTEERHEPKSNEKKKKKKKKKKRRQSEADRNVECGFCGDDAEHVGCRQNLQSSETKSQKKRKKKNRWDDADSGQDSCSGLAKELKILENHREVSVTQPEKVQQKDGSVASLLRR